MMSSVGNTTRRGRKRLSEDEELSIEEKEKRQKNRDAAKKCREKKLREFDDAKKKNADLQKENDNLKKERDALMEQIKAYENLLRDHKKRGCTIPEEICNLLNEEPDDSGTETGSRSTSSPKTSSDCPRALFSGVTLSPDASPIRRRRQGYDRKPSDDSDYSSSKGGSPVSTGSVSPVHEVPSYSASYQFDFRSITPEPIEDPVHRNLQISGNQDPPEPNLTSMGFSLEAQKEQSSVNINQDLLTPAISSFNPNEISPELHRQLSASFQQERSPDINLSKVASISRNESTETGYNQSVSRDEIQSMQRVQQEQTPMENRSIAISIPRTENPYRRYMQSLSENEAQSMQIMQQEQTPIENRSNTVSIPSTENTIRRYVQSFSENEASSMQILQQAQAVMENRSLSFPYIQGNGRIYLQLGNTSQHRIIAASNAENIDYESSMNQYQLTNAEVDQQINIEAMIPTTVAETEEITDLTSQTVHTNQNNNLPSISFEDMVNKNVFEKK